MTQNLERFAIENATKKTFVAIQYGFSLHNHINKNGESSVQLIITGNTQRERINTGIYCRPQDWDKKLKRIHHKVFNSANHNLILDNIISKITSVKTTFHLNDIPLTPARLRKELLNPTNRFCFLRFFSSQLEKERSLMSHGYYRKVKSVLTKTKAIYGELYFHEITPSFIDSHRNLLAKKGNKKTTINSNISTLKKYLNAAKKEGIRFNLETSEIKVGSMTGSRVDLNQKEIEKLFNYYVSDFAPDYLKIALGYFLFSCFTGLRLSDVLDLKRKDVLNDHVDFVAQKNGKRQIIPLIAKCKKVIQEEPGLFEKKVGRETINRHLKTIGNQMGFKKHITFHVARHSFATNFLRVGGNVVKLQKLLGHSNIRETMVYVHIVEQEASDQIALLDELF